MINIKFVREKNNFKSFSSVGHAGYNPGNDIVCSAVAALSYALLGTLQNIKNIKFQKQKISSGNMKIVLSTEDTTAKEVADIAFKTVYIGLLQLQETYPKHIKVTLISKESC